MQYFSEGNGLLIWILGLAGVMVGMAVLFSLSKRKAFTGQALVAAGVMALALIFYAISFNFPGEEVGPALIPRLWILCIILLCSPLIFFCMQGKGEKDPKSGRLAFLLFNVAILLGYFFAIPRLGYFASSFIFLAVMMYVLSCRKPVTILLVCSGWVVFSYLVFYRLLYIQLPLGFIENYL